MTSPHRRSVDELIAEHEQLQNKLADLEIEIMGEIRKRLGETTPYQFAIASGINKGNLYALVSNGRWNRRVAFEALALLDSPITRSETRA